MSKLTAEPPAIEGQDPAVQQALAEKQRWDELIRQALEREGEQGLRDIPPLTLSFCLVSDADLDDHELFLRDCVEVTPEVNPLLEAVLGKMGATRRGSRTYALNVGRHAAPEALLAVLRALPSWACYSQERIVARERNGGHEFHFAGWCELIMSLRSTPAGERLRNAVNQAFGAYYVPHVPGWMRNAAIVLTCNDNELFIKLCTIPDASGGFHLYQGAPDLNLLRPSARKPPIRVTPEVAVALFGAAQRLGYPLAKEPDFITAFRRRLREAVIAQAVPGSPGLSRLVVGSAVDTPALDGVQLQPLYEGCDFARQARMSARQAGEVLLRAASSVNYTALHPQVADVIAMEQAQVEEIPGLFADQHKAVALHQATRFGYLNASTVGSGKCVAAGTPVFLNGEYLAAEKAWHRHGDGEAVFDGEGWWTRPRTALSTLSLDSSNHLVVGRVVRLYRQRVHEPARRVVCRQTEITITNRHRLLEQHKGWTTDIRPGDRIASVADPSASQVSFSEVQAVEEVMLSGWVYDFEVETHHNYLAAGLMAHNTCMGLTGCRLKALSAHRRGRQYRALVTARASEVDQWDEECEKFFPQARRLVIRNPKRDVPRLAEHLAGCEREGVPALVICSHNAARDYVEDLCGFSWRWDDLLADEADFLASPSSQLSKAFWRLRKHCQVAVALTGTPVNKLLDDLGRIIAWVRNDPVLFAGRRLSRRFNIARDDHLQEMVQALGPVIYRVDGCELAGKLPELDTKVIPITPHQAEHALAEGARRRLHDLYRKLEEDLQRRRRLAPDDPLLAEAEQEIKALRGAALGGISIARLAACDPQAVAASDSVAAAMLDAEGLVQPAVTAGSSKRRAMVPRIAAACREGKAVLVFCDSKLVAELLVEDLRQAGVRVGAITGSMSKRRRTETRWAFQGQRCDHHTALPGAHPDCTTCRQPSLDCLVLTQAAMKGLNLQRAAVVVHYDLPWAPRAIIQRIGRARRRGSSHERIEMWVPLMRGTIEERVAAVLLPRAMTQIRALDTHRGLAAGETELGVMMGKLGEHIAEQEVAEDERSLFDLARQLLLEQAPDPTSSDL